MANLRVSLSISPKDIDFGLQVTPPLPPPYGRLVTAHFQVIQLARALTSSKLTSGWNLIPPFAGPLVMLCWTLCPVKTWTFPLSITTGKFTVNSLLQLLSTCLMPSSRFSTSAAALNCSTAISNTELFISDGSRFSCINVFLRMFYAYLLLRQFWRLCE